MPGRIFISYRRDDAAGDAGRLADHLYRRFGRDRVFLDIDTIDPGTDFTQVLRTSLRETAAVLVVIGPRWTSLRDAHGNRRLDDPQDFVRLEVESSLARDIPVVPVLVQGASLPRSSELPDSLAALVARQAVSLDHHEFRDDAERLCDRLAAMVGYRDRTWWSIARRWWPAAAALLAVTSATFLATRPGAGGGSTALVAETGSAVPQPETAPIVSEPERREASAPASTPNTGPQPTTAAAARRDESGERRAPARGGTRDPVSGAPEAPSETSRIVEEDAPRDGSTPDASPRVTEWLAAASAQRRRNQLLDALETLASAREMMPASLAVRELQEDVAMEWLRNARVQNGKGSFADVIKPALAVIDASLASAISTRRADLLAHTGWATFMLWRDGDRGLDPTDTYREALSLDPDNPYANAMLAHWLLFRGNDVPRAATLFDAALKSGRARDAIRNLQWSAYGNASGREASVERVRLADAMRRAGEPLNSTQASALYGPYYSSMSRDRDRDTLLEAIPPDDHISTLSWAFDEFNTSDESRRRTIRYYAALLHARAGRVDQAIEGLRALEKETNDHPGSLQDAVGLALERLQPAGSRRRR